MFRLNRSKLLLLVGLVSLVALLPQAALAGCSGKCEHVPGQPIFCRECVDAGHETGVLCQQSGPCGCFFVQCASLQSTLSLSEDSDTPPLLAAAEPQSACKYWEVVLEDQSLPTPLIDDSQPAPVQETDEAAPASEEATG